MHRQATYLLLPARAGPAGVVVVFAVLLTIASHAGLLGLPLVLILASWSFKYAYVLFDHVLQGFEDPPALDIQMVNPADEFRPIAQLIIVCLVFAAVFFTARVGGTVAAAVLAAIAGALLPASVAVLGIERNPLSALNPLKLHRMVVGMGRRYLCVCASVAAYALLGSLLARLQIWSLLRTAYDLFAEFSVFCFLAGSLYESRDELGLEVWRSPELTAAKLQIEDGRANEAMLTDAYGQVRAGHPAKAWDMLQTWLTGRGHRLEDYRWLTTRLTNWNDPRYANRMTEEYLERLLQGRRTGEALDALAKRLREDPSFRPKSAASTLFLAQLAAHGGGHPGIARQLLGDFAARFPGDPGCQAATALAGELGAH